MILCRKLIEGNIFVSEAESGIFEYAWLDAVDEGYEEVLVNGSKILGMDAFMHRVTNSYSFSRFEMRAFLLTRVNTDFSNWVNGITAEEKKVVSKHILAPYVLRVPSQYTDQEDIENTELLLAKTLKDRTNLIEKMRKEVFVQKVRVDALPLASSQLFYRDTRVLIDMYIKTANPEFKQWITNEVGSIYENDGFEQKSYWTQELEDELMNIYNNY